MIRISVTHLDGFDYYLKSNKDTDTYISELTTFTDNRPMKIGRSFETILQLPELTKFEDCYNCDGVKFKRNQIAKALQRYETGVWQLKHVQEFEGVQLVGKADIIQGATIIDIKTTAKIDIQRYIDSYQWRAYLMLFGANLFEYHIYQIKDEPELIDITDFELLKLNDYDGLVSDLKCVVNDFKDFIYSNNLQDYFKVKI